MARHRRPGQAQPSGELRFLGRKSEVIVTAAGVNLHPEDLEAVIEQEPGVVACAVVPLETADGPEPFAVLAFRGSGEQAAAAIERANARLAEFQRLRRWVLWPEPDLPRTSTGKVKRKAVAVWLAGIQAAAANASSGAALNAGAGAFSASTDWLLALIAQISGEAPSGVGDELHLTEDLHLDSLGRVQLAAAIEERLGAAPESGLWDRVQTLGDLRRLLGSEPESAQPSKPRPVPKSLRKAAAEIEAARLIGEARLRILFPPPLLRFLPPQAIAIRTGLGGCLSVGCASRLLRPLCVRWFGFWPIQASSRPIASTPMNPC